MSSALNGSILVVHFSQREASFDIVLGASSAIQSESNEVWDIGFELKDVVQKGVTP